MPDTSNDDDDYTDMPDLTEESVYQLEALESLESYMLRYVGRSTHQSYLNLVDHFYVGRSRARPKGAQYYACKYTSKNPGDLIDQPPLSE